MQTTIGIDDKLLQRARELTGIERTDALVHAALTTLVALEAGKRLAALGGSEPQLRPIGRRRSHC
jgi:Arc/MetJ family transcription regulator